MHMVLFIENSPVTQLYSQQFVTGRSVGQSVSGVTMCHHYVFKSDGVCSQMDIVF